MAQLELFPLVSIETIQAYCWNAHARLEILKRNPRLIPHQVQELLGEISLFLFAVERIERQLVHLEAQVEMRPAPRNLTVQHLRNLNQWPDLALTRARRYPMNRPGSMSATP